MNVGNRLDLCIFSQNQNTLEHLAQHIEALIFATENPISVDEIQKCLQEAFETKFKKEEIEKGIQSLQERYGSEAFAIEPIEIADGYQFMTKAAFHTSIGTYLKQNSKKRLSKAALETLSIIAYKQPVTKSEMEKIRGVSCDYSIQKLLEKELVSITGRSEGPGRPLLYGTSQKFMDYFGLKSLKDLPKPKDFKEPDSQIGEQAPIEETVSAEAITTQEDIPTSSE
ncbi:MAG: SMC-Scp complex subunit ScpB [Saprospiraceae bacterium]|jgi:segregation and condensation protein B|nr:SMC-Scp complex subunit ScpB [Saprospiraceae bacterium]